MIKRNDFFIFILSFVLSPHLYSAIDLPDGMGKCPDGTDINLSEGDIKGLFEETTPKISKPGKAVIFRGEKSIKKPQKDSTVESANKRPSSDRSITLTETSPIQKSGGTPPRSKGEVKRVDGPNIHAAKTVEAPAITKNRETPDVPTSSGRSAVSKVPETPEAISTAQLTTFLNDFTPLGFNRKKMTSEFKEENPLNSFVNPIVAKHTHYQSSTLPGHNGYVLELKTGPGENIPYQIKDPKKLKQVLDDEFIDTDHITLDRELHLRLEELFQGQAPMAGGSSNVYNLPFTNHVIKIPQSDTSQRAIRNFFSLTSKLDDISKHVFIPVKRTKQGERVNKQLFGVLNCVSPKLAEKGVCIQKAIDFEVPPANRTYKGNLFTDPEILQARKDIESSLKSSYAEQLISSDKIDFKRLMKTFHPSLLKESIAPFKLKNILTLISDPRDLQEVPMHILLNEFSPYQLEKIFPTNDEIFKAMSSKEINHFFLRPAELKIPAEKLGDKDFIANKIQEAREKLKFTESDQVFRSNVKERLDEFISASSKTFLKKRPMTKAKNDLLDYLKKNKDDLQYVYKKEELEEILKQVGTERDQIITFLSMVKKDKVSIRPEKNLPDSVRDNMLSQRRSEMQLFVDTISKAESELYAERLKDLNKNYNSLELDNIALASHLFQYPHLLKNRKMRAMKHHYYESRNTTQDSLNNVLNQAGSFLAENEAKIMRSNKAGNVSNTDAESKIIPIDPPGTTTAEQRGRMMHNLNFRDFHFPQNGVESTDRIFNVNGVLNIKDEGPIIQVPDA